MSTPRVPRLSHVRRPLRILIGVTLTVLAVTYILLKIDLEQTWETLKAANLWWFALAVTIMIVTALPMALRWKWLLAAQGVIDRFWWLTRAYFVSYTAGQILPTSIGGDAVRIFEVSKRHPGRSGDLTAIVVIERGLGGAATVLLGAIGFVLAIGHYDVERVSLDRGAVRLRDAAPDRPLLLAVGPAAPRPAAPVAPAAAPRAAAARVLRRRAPLPWPPGPDDQGLRVHDR